MATVRFPAVVLVPAAVVAALVLGPQPGEAPPPAPESGAAADAALADVPAAETVATAAAPGARGSTWFCPPGTATGDGEGFAEQVVVLANAGENPVTATLTVVPDEGEARTSDVPLPPSSRVAVEVSELVEASWAAVMVEADGGEVAVDRLLRGATGTALVPCASTPTDRAWFPSGATEEGAREVLAVFNPFPDEAVVRVTFETEQGARTPEDLEARVVPPRSVVVLDLGDRVAVRRDVATTLEVTAGQVVVDRIQSFDGSGGRSGLAVSSGAPRPRLVWWFPEAELGGGRHTSVVVQNPDRDEVARVEVAVLADGTGPDEQPEPFAVEVAPGRYLSVALDRDGRVPPDTPFAVVVTGTDGHEVVAEIVTRTEDGDGAPTGSSYASGSPVAAPRWITPLGSLSGTTSATISVANPADRDVVVRLEGFSDGRRTTVAEGVTVAAGGRVDLDVTGGADLHPAAFEVLADGPVVVSRRFLLEDGEVTDALAVAVADGAASVPAPASG